MTALRAGFEFGKEVEQPGGLPRSIALRFREREQDARVDEVVDGDSCGGLASPGHGVDSVRSSSLTSGRRAGRARSLSEPISASAPETTPASSAGMGGLKSLSLSGRKASYLQALRYFGGA